LVTRTVPAGMASPPAGIARKAPGGSRGTGHSAPKESDFLTVYFAVHTEDPADGRLRHAAPPTNLKPRHSTGRSSWDSSVVSEIELVQVDLDDDERAFLRAALLDWGGPAAPTNGIATAMGFSDAQRLSSETWSLWKQIEAGQGLSVPDWRRTLLAVEIVFASDVVGSGLDWSITSGISDEQSSPSCAGSSASCPAGGARSSSTWTTPAMPRSRTRKGPKPSST
jgi:hypothetical protein